MIAELLAWARMDCLPAAQRAGLRLEAAALAVRHRRLRAHWAGHLAHTRAALLQSARASAGCARPPRRAWVMGAGQLKDVPLPELLELFDRVDLVDVCFGPAARQAERAHPERVRCVALDVTGLLDDLGRDPESAAPALPDDAWCASVNLLSQLPLAPCAALLSAGKGDEAVERIGHAIQRAHLDRLQATSHACLIIEYAQTVQGSADELLLPGLPARLEQTGWTMSGHWHWPLHPAGERRRVEGRAMQAWQRNT